MAHLPPGKLRMELLADLLGSVQRHDPRVVIGPSVGEDAAVMEMGGGYLVAKSDPITFATDQIGRYAVHVNANDIATRGAVPLWFLATVLLPEVGTDEALVRGIFAQIVEACDELGIVVVGGHTEVTAGLDRPIVCGTMLGEVSKEALITTGGIRPGDHVLMAQSVPLEGVCLIAREKRAELLDAGFSPEDLDSAAALFDHPGICIVGAARIANAAGGVTSMHDPTEGGLATALTEMALAAGTGLRIERARIPLAPMAEELCRHYGLDAFGTISSGALLIGAAPTASVRILNALHRAGIPAVDIGYATSHDEGVCFVSGEGGIVPIRCFDQDEIARIF